MDLTNTDPCILCKGTGANHHEAPPGVSFEEWFKKVGILNRCPLCQGTGEQRYLIWNGERRAISVHSMSTSSGKVLAACMYPGCDQWADCTGYMDRGKLTENNTIATCPNGHALKMNITLNGKNR